MLTVMHQQLGLNMPHDEGLATPGNPGSENFGLPHLQYKLEMLRAEQALQNKLLNSLYMQLIGG